MGIMTKGTTTGADATVVILNPQVERVAERIRRLMETRPDLSRRQVAARVGCCPTYVNHVVAGDHGGYTPRVEAVTMVVGPWFEDERGVPTRLIYGV